ARGTDSPARTAKFPSSSAVSLIHLTAELMTDFSKRPRPRAIAIRGNEVFGRSAKVATQARSPPAPSGVARPAAAALDPQTSQGQRDVSHIDVAPRQRRDLPRSDPVFDPVFDLRRDAFLLRQIGIGYRDSDRTLSKRRWIGSRRKPAFVVVGALPHDC